MVSGILIALQTKQFEKTENLSEELVNAITERIDNNDAALIECYNFIKTHKQLQNSDNLYELINDIDNNIFEFIKKDWVRYFKARKEKSGFSVIKTLTAEDEWCAEKYMDTDYSKLTREDFELVVREYIGYKFINNL